MINKNEIIEKNTNINSTLEHLHSSNKLISNYENITKQLEEEYIKKATYSSPKNINKNSYPIGHQNLKNFANNNELQSKIETFQHVAKSTRKKIAPIEGKNGFMNKTNKPNDFMKYINKTLYPDNNKKSNDDTVHIRNNEFSKIKSMSDMKSPLELLNLNTPKNMKKTLNSIVIKNNNSNKNIYNHLSNNFASNQNNYTNFNNAFTNSHLTSHGGALAYLHTQSMNETTFKNFINQNNYGNNFPYPSVCLSSNINNNNSNQINNNVPNYLSQSSTFLFDISNLSKYSKTESAKFATKPAGIISSFGVNTNFGNVRYKFII